MRSLSRRLCPDSPLAPLLGVFVGEEAPLPLLLPVAPPFSALSFDHRRLPDFSVVPVRDSSEK